MHEDEMEGSDEGLSAEARELEAQLHRYAREGMNAAGQSGADPDERTVQAMYAQTQALNPGEGFYARSAQAAIALVQGGDRRAPWPYWYPWLPLAAAVGLIVVAMTFLKRPPTVDNPGGAPLVENDQADGQDDNAAAADGSGDQDGNTPVPGGDTKPVYRDVPVSWSDVENGMRLGVRLLNESGLPTDRLDVFEQAKVEIYVRNEGEYPVNVLMSKGAVTAGQLYPYLYPLQAHLSVDGESLSRNAEDPVYPLGVDLDNTFSLNEIGDGVTNKAVVTLSSLCRAGFLMPASVENRNVYDGALLRPGQYTLSLTYCNSLRSMGKNVLWTGSMAVSVSFARSPIGFETPATMLRDMERLRNLSDIDWTLQQIVAVMGNAYKRQFRSQVQGGGGPARVDAGTWIHAGDWLVGLYEYTEGCFQFADYYLYLPALCGGKPNEPWASAVSDGVRHYTRLDEKEFRTAMFTLWEDGPGRRRPSSDPEKRVDVLVFNPTDKPLVLPAFACFKQEMGFDIVDLEGASLTGVTPTGISKEIIIKPHSFYGYNVGLGYYQPDANGEGYSGVSVQAPEMALSNRAWVKAADGEKTYLTLTTNTIYCPQK